ncbi:hypothetical protein F4820DRAFT_327327 [Hypoxylon rubiginosum]|uniref:Uncharacterized protein n=1 Tax=Hypoxylon rubiginosum TaxID=110542 RepID=A0ACB9YZ96_9PEZI|nr:hypothetical protein F4820DRAFT_327327 [Hypoxylon rubiginosum]
MVIGWSSQQLTLAQTPPFPPHIHTHHLLIRQSLSSPTQPFNNNLMYAYCTHAHDPPSRIHTHIPSLFEVETMGFRCRNHPPASHHPGTVLAHGGQENGWATGVYSSKCCCCAWYGCLRPDSALPNHRYSPVLLFCVSLCVSASNDGLAQSGNHQPPLRDAFLLLLFLKRHYRPTARPIPIVPIPTCLPGAGRVMLRAQAPIPGE